MAVNPLAAAGTELRAFALRFPGASEEFPWGNSALYVATTIFAMLRVDASARRSLPLEPGDGHDAALALPFARPTGNHLGRSGWVTSIFEQGAAVATAILRKELAV